MSKAVCPSLFSLLNLVYKSKDESQYLHFQTYKPSLLSPFHLSLANQHLFGQSKMILTFPNLQIRLHQYVSIVSHNIDLNALQRLLYVAFACRRRHMRYTKLANVNSFFLYHQHTFYNLLVRHKY